MNIKMIVLIIHLALIASCANNSEEDLLKAVPSNKATALEHDLRFDFVTADNSTTLQTAVNTLSDDFEYWVKSQKIVGGEMLILHDNTLLLHQAIGWNDREQNQALVLDQVFFIESLSYLFIETAILVLADEDQLDLCLPVASYLPVFDNDKSREISIEQLMLNSSGFTKKEYQKPREKYDSIEDAIAEIAAEGPQVTPGTIHLGNGINLDILAILIETVTGQSLQHYLSEILFNPLSLENTTLDLASKPELIEKLVAHYQQNDEGKFIKTWDNSMPEPETSQWLTTSAYASITDYAIFLSLWNNNGLYQDKRIVSEQRFKHWKEILYREINNDEPSECLFNTLQNTTTHLSQNQPRYLASRGPEIIALPKSKLLGLYFTQTPWNNSHGLFWSKMTDIESQLNWQ